MTILSVYSEISNILTVQQLLSKDTKNATLISIMIAFHVLRTAYTWKLQKDATIRETNPESLSLHLLEYWVICYGMSSNNPMLMGLLAGAIHYINASGPKFEPHVDITVIMMSMYILYNSTTPQSKFFAIRELTYHFIEMINSHTECKNIQS
jgi:hypothetical protein